MVGHAPMARGSLGGRDGLRLRLDDRVPGRSLIARVKFVCVGFDACRAQSSLRGRRYCPACWRWGSDGSKWCARSVGRRSIGSDLVLATRPGWTHSEAWPSRLEAVGRRLQIAARSSKGDPFRHMACRMTASLRAKATLALRGPVFLARASAHSRKPAPPILRVIKALAAS